MLGLGPAACPDRDAAAEHEGHVGLAEHRGDLLQALEQLSKVTSVSLTSARYPARPRLESVEFRHARPIRLAAAGDVHAEQANRAPTLARLRRARRRRRSRPARGRPDHATASRSRPPCSPRPAPARDAGLRRARQPRLALNHVPRARRAPSRGRACACSTELGRRSEIGGASVGVAGAEGVRRRFPRLAATGLRRADRCAGLRRDEAEVDALEPRLDGDGRLRRTASCSCTTRRRATTLEGEPRGSGPSSAPTASPSRSPPTGRTSSCTAMPTRARSRARSATCPSSTWRCPSWAATSCLRARRRPRVRPTARPRLR